jgi:predicted dehydrogenase
MVLTNAEGIKKQIYFETPEIDNNNAILDELETFADAINNNTTPIVTLAQGTEALRVAMQVIENFKEI